MKSHDYIQPGPLRIAHKADDVQIRGLRPNGEETGHIPGARLVPMQRVHDFQPRGRMTETPVPDARQLHNGQLGRQLQHEIEQLLISQLFTRAITADAICKQLGRSRSYVHKTLKAHTGMSLTHFVQSIRVKRAIELLEHSDLNISEVAYDVGFADPAYFSRVFKRHMGISPREFQRLPLSNPTSES